MQNQWVFQNASRTGSVQSKGLFKLLAGAGKRLQILRIETPNHLKNGHFCANNKGSDDGTSFAEVQVLLLHYTMITPLHVLYMAAEGSYAVQQAMEHAGYSPEIVTVGSVAGLLSEMNAREWDVLIVDDTKAPAEDILALAAECPDTPALVCITKIDNERLSTLDEEVHCTENLEKLGAVVARAIRLKSGKERDEASDEQSSDSVSHEQIESPVAESETHQLAEHLPIGLFQSTPDGRMLYANSAMVDLMGFTSFEEIANMDIEDLGYPRDQFLAKLERDEEIRDHVIRWTDRQGRTKYTRENVRTVKSADGKVLYYEGTMADVTDEKNREEEDSRVSEKNLAEQKALVEISALPTTDFSTTAQRATELICKTSSVDTAVIYLADDPGKDVRCINVYSMADAEHEREPSYPFGDFLPAFSIFGSERCIVISDTKNDKLSKEIGASEYFEQHDIGAVLAAPIRQGGNVLGLVAVHHKSTPREWTVSDIDFVASIGDLLAITLERIETAEAEHALRESEARYKAISELASDYSFGVHIYPDGHDAIEWATEAFERITGYSIDELEGLNGLLSIVHQSMQDETREAFSRLTDGEFIETELHIVTKDGAEKWIRHRGRRMEDLDEEIIVLFNSGQDITSKKIFEKQLIETREEALETARTKSAFLANMSHEIRTPLTGIMGFAGLLMDEADGEAYNFARNIEQSSKRLMNTLNSVLDMARLEAGKVDIDLEVVDLVQEAEQTAEAMQKMAGDKGLEIRVEAPEDPVFAKLDTGCICRVFTNLVGNAIKFTPEGSVTIKVAADGDIARVQVIDTGLGIDEEFLPHLFDEFRQEGKRDGEQREGTGLGLAISKRLVDMMGGAIHVASKRPGGSTFTIEFPRVQEDGLETEVTKKAPPSPDSTQDLTAEDAIIIRPNNDKDVAEEVSVEEPEGVFAQNEQPEEESEAGEFVAVLEEEEAESGAAVRTEQEEAQLLDEFEEAVDDASETLAINDDEPPEESDPSQHHEEEVLNSSSVEDELNEQEVEEESSGAKEIQGEAEPELNEADEPVAAAGLNSNGQEETEQVDEPVDSESETPELPELEDDRPSVLVVEDNPDTRMLVERIVGRKYQVSAVGDARSALAQLNTNSFDALVLDINLGGKETGVDILRIARTLPGYEDIFAISLTAYALPGDRERFLSAGFNRYVSKPFTRSTLMSALAEGIPEEIYEEIPA